MSNSGSQRARVLTPVPQTPATPTGTFASATEEQVLLDARKKILDKKVPWYEMLTLKYDAATSESGVAAVGAVLVENAISDAVSETPFEPVLTVVQSLINVARTSANLRKDILDNIEYFVAITKCVIVISKKGNLPDPVKEIVAELQDDVKKVSEIAQRFVSPIWFFFKCVRNTQDKGELENIRQKSVDKLRFISRILVTTEFTSTNENARVPREVPRLPRAYVRRDEDDSVAEDLIDTSHPDFCCHCVWGMGGVGKTLLASSVLHDERVRRSFRGEVYWVNVGEKALTGTLPRLLETFAEGFVERTAGRSLDWPDSLHGTEEIVRHLQWARRDSRCLVVLDDVWYEEVINAFASAGFHLLVTTRRRTVVPKKWSRGFKGFTELRSMENETAVELLKKESQAAGPLPEHEARLVCKACGNLPLALSMVGRLGKGDPLDPKSWRGILHRLQDKDEFWKEQHVNDDGGVLFPVIDKTVDMLPEELKRRFWMMIALPAGAPVKKEMMAKLWGTEDERDEEDIKVLAEYSLLETESGVSRLHELTRDYLQLYGKMIPNIVSQAIERQAKFMATPEILQAYTRGGVDGKYGICLLIRLWARIKRLDRSRTVWNETKETFEASSDTEYMKELGEFLTIMGEYAHAEEVLARLVREEEKSEPQKLCSALTLLGRSLEGQGKNDEAETRYRRAVELTEKHFGAEHSDCSIRLGRLAGVLTKQGKYDEGEPLHCRAIQITENTLGHKHPEYSARLCGLARLKEYQGKHEKAEDLYRQAIEIAEVAPGVEHPDYASRLTDLAGLLEKKGSDDEAELLYHRGMAIVEDTLGTTHPEFRTLLIRFARFLANQNEYKKAERLERCALDLTEAILGKDHPDHLVRLSTLGSLVEKQGKYEEAEFFYRRAVDITQSDLDADNSEYVSKLNDLVGSLEKQEKFDEAEEQYHLAIAHMESTVGANHPEFLTILRSLQSLLEKQRKYDEAEPLAQRAAALANSISDSG